MSTAGNNSSVHQPTETPRKRLINQLMWPPHVLWSSGISRKLGESIVRYSQKEELMNFVFVFYCFENSSIAHNFGNTGPIQVGFSAKCTSPKEHFNQIENWKCHMFDFRQISLLFVCFVLFLILFTIKPFILYVKIDYLILQQRLLFLPRSKIDVASIFDKCAFALKNRATTASSTCDAWSWPATVH